MCLAVGKIIQNVLDGLCWEGRGAAWGTVIYFLLVIEDDNLEGGYAHIF